MLNFDIEGRMIAPGALVKGTGGSFDQNGQPVGYDIPTTGAFSGVTVTDNGDFAKYVNRAANTPGKARVQGPAVSVSSSVRALHMQAAIVGGGSSATSGNTRCGLRLGFLSDDGNSGGALEYRSSDSSPDGTFLTAYSGGSATRQSVAHQINNPAERYLLDLWLSRMPSGAWQLTSGERGNIRQIARFSGAQLAVGTLRPVVEWDWTYATGSFQRRIAQMTMQTYWDF